MAKDILISEHKSGRETVRTLIGFQGNDQTPSVLVYREFWVGREVVWAEVIWKLDELVVLMVNDAILGVYTSEENADQAVEQFKASQPWRNWNHIHFHQHAAVADGEPRIC